MILLRLAWRNIFRNKRLTILSSIAIGLGLASLMFTDALMIGMIDSMIRAATDTFLGHAQIHAHGFRDTFEVDMTINNIDDVINDLQKEEIVSGFSLRTQAFGMIASPFNATSIMLYGIDPQMEKNVSRVDEAVIRGSYLSTDGNHKILVGTKLAEILKVDIGDRIVITTARAKTGELSQEMFRVGGIFQFNVKEMDNEMAFISLDESRSLLGIDGGAHEIAISFSDMAIADDPSNPFWKHYSLYGNEATSWRKLMRELDAVLNLSDFTKYIIALILFGIVALTILNTLFTSLFERLFEFGVLRAIGTRPLRMASIIILEAISLAIVSSIMGLIIGTIAIYIFSVYGIDYRGIEFAEVTFREVIYPVMTLNQYIEYPVWIIFFSLVAGIYPAMFAARLTPSRVLRRTL